MLFVMRAYSLDLRERIVAARQEGQTEKQVADRFGVSESTVTRYTRLARHHKPLCAKKPPGKTPLLRPEQEPELLALLATGGDWTLETMRAAWQQKSGVVLSKSAMHQHLKRLGVTYKKRANTPKSVLPQSGLPS